MKPPSTTSTITPEVESIFKDCPENCGNNHNPGAGIDFPGVVDFSQLETSIDQSAIEAVFDTFDLAGKHLLHVGIGNSKLAARFASRLDSVDGLTVSRAELTHAEALRIRNYRVSLVSKYASDLLEHLTSAYDFIIDNNLASFACCRHHLYLMMQHYVQLLEPDGQILTDQVGMDWTFEDDPRWRLSYSDLVALGNLFGLATSRLSDTVYSLRRPER